MLAKNLTTKTNNMQDKIKQIEKAIRESNPELMELSFGCEVEYKDEYGVEKGFITWIRNKGVSNTKMTVSNIGDCHLDDVEIEIIGHPIHLEHVLVAIYNAENSPLMSIRYSLANERLPKGTRYVDFIGLGGEDLVYRYNLKKSFKENLEENEELVEFLYKVLIK